MASREAHLPPEAVVLVTEPDAGAVAVGGPATSTNQREVGQGDGLEDSGANSARLAFGQGELGVWLARHGDLREKNQGKIVPACRIID